MWAAQPTVLVWDADEVLKMLRNESCAWSTSAGWNSLMFAQRHPAIYLPFGGGAHACIGMQLANLEAKLLFSMLLTRCRIELAHDYEGRHTLTPLGTVSGKVRLKLTPIA